MSIKNALKGWGIIEDTSEEVSVDYTTVLTVQQEVPEVKIEIDGLSVIPVVELYDRFDLSIEDYPKNIFKVTEFSANFPSTLPEAVRKQSTIGVLNTAGFPVDDLRLDGETRINALEDALESIARDTVEMAEENTQNIIKLQAVIEELKSKNIEIDRIFSEQKKLIETEVGNIHSILEFIKA